MGRVSHALGVLLPGLPKDMRFWGTFGVSAEVAAKAWGMMEEHDLLPLIPSFAITCGRFPLCARTLPRMQLSQGCWGGVTRRRSTSICGRTLGHLQNWSTLS
jgi:hypothetical protein